MQKEEEKSQESSKNSIIVDSPSNLSELNELSQQMITKYNLKNYHYSELFLYFLNFIEDNLTISKESFIKANSYLISSGSSNEKDVEEFSGQIFNLIKINHKDNLSKLDLLAPYLKKISNTNEIDMDTLYDILDKNDKGFIEYQDVKHLINLLEDFTNCFTSWKDFDESFTGTKKMTRRNLSQNGFLDNVKTLFDKAEKIMNEKIEESTKNVIEEEEEKEKENIVSKEKNIENEKIEGEDKIKNYKNIKKVFFSGNVGVEHNRQKKKNYSNKLVNTLFLNEQTDKNVKMNNSSLNYEKNNLRSTNQIFNSISNVNNKINKTYQEKEEDKKVLNENTKNPITNQNSISTINKKSNSNHKILKNANKNKNLFSPEKNNKSINYLNSLTGSKKEIPKIQINHAKTFYKKVCNKLSADQNQIQHDSNSINKIAIIKTGEKKKYKLESDDSLRNYIDKNEDENSNIKAKDNAPVNNNLISTETNNVSSIKHIPELENSYEKKNNSINYKNTPENKNNIPKKCRNILNLKDCSKIQRKTEKIKNTFELQKKYEKIMNDIKNIKKEDGSARNNKFGNNLTLDNLNANAKNNRIEFSPKKVKFAKEHSCQNNNNANANNKENNKLYINSPSTSPKKDFIKSNLTHSIENFVDQKKIKEVKIIKLITYLYDTKLNDFVNYFSQFKKIENFSKDIFMEKIFRLISFSNLVFPNQKLGLSMFYNLIDYEHKNSVSYYEIIGSLFILLKGSFEEKVNYFLSFFAQSKNICLKVIQGLINLYINNQLIKDSLILSELIYHFIIDYNLKDSKEFISWLKSDDNNLINEFSLDKGLTNQTIMLDVSDINDGYENSHYDNKVFDIQKNLFLSKIKEGLIIFNNKIPDEIKSISISEITKQLIFISNYDRINNIQLNTFIDSIFIDYNKSIYNTGNNNFNKQNKTLIKFKKIVEQYFPFSSSEFYDIKQIHSFLILIFQGNKAEKVESIFEIHKIEENGNISISSLEKYFSNSIQFIFEDFNFEGKNSLDVSSLLKYILTSGKEKEGISLNDFLFDNQNNNLLFI